MVDTNLEIFKNRLQRELLDLNDLVYAAFVKARQDGQTNPLIAFKDFIGFKICCYKNEGGP
jgi:hypothetical protein